MAKLYAQAAESVLETAATLAISASVAGSAICQGHARLVGLLWSNASAAAGAGSGLHFLESSDYGVHWDTIAASQAITASTAASVNLTLIGNAVKVQVGNGATAASIFRASFRLYPV